MTAHADNVLTARDVSVRFESETGTRDALSGVNLEIVHGEVVAILGPSGCGKSTLLSILGGFAQPSSGEVLLDGRPITAPDRRVVTIFQDYGLFPWRSALGNVEFGLAIAGVPRVVRKKQARKWLELVGLGGFEKAHVTELSGGMRQRVNLARALAVEPEVLLMDEPMGALDAITKTQVQEELRDIARASSATIVLVTHDVDEAVFLADRVLVMTPCPGTIAEEIRVRFSHPRDRASADFLALRTRLLESLHLAHRFEPEYGI